mgnify:CR=1 FL=1
MAGDLGVEVVVAGGIDFGPVDVGDLLFGRDIIFLKVSSGDSFLHAEVLSR